MASEPTRRDKRYGGRYAPIGLLKRGMGVETWLGTDLATGKDVILKIGDPDTVPGGVLQRLEHESRILASGVGESRTAVLHTGLEDREFCFVFPFVPGITLQESLRQGPLSVGESLLVAERLFQALREAHDLGVIHRDVKPANVIVNASRPLSEATLIDFGFALNKRLDATIRDVPVETVRYLSPEQAGLLDREVDGRSDLYSAGVLLFECLAGAPPFPGKDVGELLRQHISMPAPELRARGITVPKALDEVIQRLLRKDPRLRYQGADAVLADVTEIADGLRQGIAEPALIIGMRDHRGTLSEPAFVGRVGELDKLSKELEKARRGQGELVVVEAYSGGGKTRLLEEFALRSALEGSRPFRGQGVDQAALRPFQMLAGVADGIRAASRLDLDLVERLKRDLGERAPTVCEAMPELGPVLGIERGGPAGPEAFGEARSLQALAGLLDSLGSPAHPAVMLLDDCQWADDLSIKLLKHWRTRRVDAANRNLLLIVSYRTEEVPPDHPLRKINPGLHLDIPPLESGEVRKIAASMAGELPEEAVQAIDALSKGSPFMASAVLRGLIETGALDFEEGRWQVRAKALMEIQSSRKAAAFLARRLQLLEADALALLRVGSVLGKGFDLGLAASLAHSNPRKAIEDLREARARHIVWIGANGQYAFAHDKLREALLAEMTAEERRRLHLEAAESILQRTPEAVFELAFHYDAAEESGKAFPFALAAAEQARARYSLAISERHYRIAARGAQDEDRPTRFRIQEGLGDVLMLMGRYPDAASEMETAASLAHGPYERAKMAGKIGELAYKKGDPDTSIGKTEEAIRLLGHSVPRRRPALVASVLRQVAIQCLHTWFPGFFLGRRKAKDSREDLLAVKFHNRLTYVYWATQGKAKIIWTHFRGLNLAEAYPPSLELAQAYMIHGSIMSLFRSLFPRALRYQEKALEIRKSFGDTWAIGQSLHAFGSVYYAAARWAEYIEKGRQGLRILEVTGDRWEELMCRWHLSVCLYRMGRLREALQLSRQQHEAALEIGDNQNLGQSLYPWSAASGGRIREGLAGDWLRRPTSDVMVKANVCIAEGIRLLREGRPEEAVEILAASAAELEKVGMMTHYVSPILPWLATALREAAEKTSIWQMEKRREFEARAGAVSRKALKVARRYQSELPHVLRERAFLACLSGRTEKSRRLLEESLAVAESQGARYEHARSLLARGQLGKLLGWPGATTDEIRAGKALAEMEEGTRPPTAAKDVPTLSLLDRFDTVLDVGRKIATALTHDAVMESLRHAASTLLRGERSVVIPVRRREGSAKAVPPEEERDVSLSLLNKALAAGRPVVASEESALGAADESLLLAGIRSALAVPILVRGEAVACLYVSHRLVGGIFGPEEEKLAEYIAALAGAAMENAPLYEGLQLEIAVRTRTEKALNESKALLQNIMDSSSAVIYVKDLDGRYLLINRRYEDLFHVSKQSVAGNTDYDYFSKEQADVFGSNDRRVLETGNSMEWEESVTQDDGLHTYIAVKSPLRDESGRLYAVCGIATDITHVKLVEEQFRQSQKMEAVGRLAGGIAHDFNNLLTVINGYCTMILHGMEPSHPNFEFMTEILKAGERASGLTRQLLAYSRKQVLEPKVWNLNVIVSDMQGMLRRILGEDVALIAAMAPDLGLVKVDRGQVEQIILNLAVNARDAMPGGGKLTVETANVTLDHHYLGSHLEATPGPHVVLSVRDTGAGMSPEVKSRLFEPFFTTKAAGEGTGLGLSVVYGIVKQSGGSISVYSEVDMGTIFRIYFPEIKQAGAAIPERLPDGIQDLYRGDETILLVEDEESVRRFARHALEAHGYRILEAGNGIEAIRLLDESSHRIDLLITDLVMPDMGGLALAVKVGQLMPSMPILYMSGFTENAAVHGGVVKPGENFLQKPFSPSELARKAREALTRAGKDRVVPA